MHLFGAQLVSESGCEGKVLRLHCSIHLCLERDDLCESVQAFIGGDVAVHIPINALALHHLLDLQARSAEPAEDGIHWQAWKACV